MSTEKKEDFSLSARFLGPILSLDATLTKHDQNLIFARNGTGKSFLSRALRYLDLYSQGADISDAALCLISDESADGKGELSISSGSRILGKIKLAKAGEPTIEKSEDTIFHVFSEDFLHQELRERKYEFDGNIENQIAVDGDNIKLSEAKESRARILKQAQTSLSEISEKFEKEKTKNVIQKAGVNRQLREFRALNIDDLMASRAEKPQAPTKAFTDLLLDLDSLKAIPAEPAYAEQIDELSIDDVSLDELEALLQTVTSPSTVSEEIKRKIDSHLDFFRTGYKIVQDDHRSTCPFCEQDINAGEVKSVIDAYVKYFEDEEQRHKSKLREFYKLLISHESDLRDLEGDISRQLNRHNALKALVPSQRDTHHLDLNDELEKIRAIIGSMKKEIEQKAANLAIPKTLAGLDLTKAVEALNAKIGVNNLATESVSQAVKRADEERKTIQRAACEAFETEFAISHWTSIDQLRALRKAAEDALVEIAALERARPSGSARSRVADTFESLLKEFFGEKYVFDKVGFILRRGPSEMSRGAHRTLSEGEKTAIAFCYFIACVHKKVEKGSDYRRMFLVFDDPITSMSYDYVFAIAQVLKNLTFSETGEVSTVAGKADTKGFFFPRLLILTHSSYFFNVCVANRVIHDNASCSLQNEGPSHKLVKLNKYIAPFSQQLLDISDVANGKEPDHRTGNSIRSVLEAIGRFCRPDKAESLSVFIQHLGRDEGINIKSVLINSLCHGTYYEETPHPDDLKQACIEALEVVKRFAPGQLELLATKAKSSKQTPNVHS